MNTYITLAIALLIAYVLLRRFELYSLSTSRTLFLDKNWNETLNKPKRVSDPFNTCSPESYGGCAKIAFPNLSRY
jgi:hypothetical protein